MATILINEDYKVETDDLNLTLWKRYTVPENKAKGIPAHDSYKHIGYYGQWEHVADKMIRLMINDEIDDICIAHVSEMKDIIIKTRDEVKSIFTRMIEEGLVENL